jgi:hypothetical protein
LCTISGRQKWRTAEFPLDKGKSVRVNLSVPADMDAILSGLAAKTGTSKASFVMQALRWYLPDLRVKLAEFDEVQAHIRRRQRLAANGTARWKSPTNGSCRAKSGESWNVSD